MYGEFLNQVPTLSGNMRKSIIQNLNDIVELHEEILNDLDGIVSKSQYSQNEPNSVINMHNVHGHQRGHSLDILLKDIPRLHCLQIIKGKVIEPRVAEQVARVFGEKVSSSAHLASHRSD